MFIIEIFLKKKNSSKIGKPDSEFLCIEQEEFWFPWISMLTRDSSNSLYQEKSPGRNPLSSTLEALSIQLECRYIIMLAEFLTQPT